MFKILFICTDNIGRSLVVEYLLRDILEKAGRDDIEVLSAGICADSDISSFCFAHIDKLQKMGIDVSKHQRTQLTYEILKDVDLALAMDGTQKDWIKNRFGVDVALYNEFYKNEKTPVLISSPGIMGTLEEKCLRMVDYFEKSLPVVLKKIDEGHL